MQKVKRKSTVVNKNLNDTSARGTVFSRLSEVDRSKSCIPSTREDRKLPYAGYE